MGNCMRFEVYMAVKPSALIWVMAPCTYCGK